MAGDAARTVSPLELHGPRQAGQEDLLTPAALGFLVDLQRTFEPQRQARLAARRQRQARFDAGELPDFRADTRAIREGDWTVAPVPAALLDRRVEITGPVDPKMVINALNSGASCYMADFEDSTCPPWETLLTGQHALPKAVAGRLDWMAPERRTPYVLDAAADAAGQRGLRAIIAGAGGAAHLPGMLAAKTAVPVLGVPVQSKALNGMDSLLSIVQMPAGIPVATFAIGNAGAANAGLFAAAMLAAEHPAIGAALAAFRARQTDDVMAHDDPRQPL